MEIDIALPDVKPPLDRAYALSMTIKSFKGRRDVDVHLFRSHWDPSEETMQSWGGLLEMPFDQAAKQIILESFTNQEMNSIVEYLKEQYAERLSAIRAYPLTFPVPQGLMPLSKVEGGKGIGLILFEKIPSYTLDIPLHGFYDLGQHPPLVQG